MLQSRPIRAAVLRDIQSDRPVGYIHQSTYWQIVRLAAKHPDIQALQDAKAMALTALFSPSREGR
jgi:hypothetical protein